MILQVWEAYEHRHILSWAWDASLSIQTLATRYMTQRSMTLEDEDETKIGKSMTYCQRVIMPLCGAYELQLTSELMSGLGQSTSDTIVRASSQLIAQAADLMEGKAAFFQLVVSQTNVLGSSTLDGTDRTGQWAILRSLDMGWNFTPLKWPCKYGWWFRNPAFTSGYVVYPIIYRVSYMLGSGFLPSTVFHQETLEEWCPVGNFK